MIPCWKERKGKCGNNIVQVRSTRQVWVMWVIKMKTTGVTEYEAEYNKVRQDNYDGLVLGRKGRGNV